jgi:rubrerythrin
MEQAIRNAVTRRLVRSPEGRAHLLNLAVDAEEGDEAGIFEQIEALIDEPRLARLVARHREDEARHAQLFRDCLARLGLEEEPVPTQLKLIRRIAGVDGGFGEVRVGRDDVANIYALLLAIEERGVQQFPLIAAAFDRVDPETAATYRQVTKDEQRHVKYCGTVGRRYAPDDAAWDLAVEGARAVERTAFHDLGVAQLSYVVRNNLVALPRPAAFLARTVDRVATRAAA